MGKPRKQGFSIQSFLFGFSRGSARKQPPLKGDGFAADCHHHHPVAALEMSIPAVEKEPGFPGLIAPVPAFSADGDAFRGGVTCIFGESLWRPLAWPTPSRTDVEGWDSALGGEAQTAALLGPGAREHADPLERARR